jgi:hypothetical protein
MEKEIDHVNENPSVARTQSQGFSQELSPIGNYSTLVDFGHECVLISCG